VSTPVSFPCSCDLASAAACALGIAACFAFFANRASIHALASALSASLCKTKKLASPSSFPVVVTVFTAVAQSTADDGSSPVAIDCDSVIDVDMTVM
jgi:hypothetical protein